MIGVCCISSHLFSSQVNGAPVSMCLTYISARFTYTHEEGSCPLGTFMLLSVGRSCVEGAVMQHADTDELKEHERVKKWNGLVSAQERLVADAFHSAAALLLLCI